VVIGTDYIGKVVIGTDCIGNCKFNFHTITTAPSNIKSRNFGLYFRLSSGYSTKTFWNGLTLASSFAFNPDWTHLLQ
jgi:hypothetical protein